RAAPQVSPDRYADHDGARECVVRPVPQHRQLVADLHHRGPDVVEELNLDDGLEAARGHAGGAADDVGLGERRVEDPVAAERPLEAVRDLEYAALARDRRQRVRSTAVGYVLAKDDDPRVAGHLVLEGAID